jgi:hypothetical protein
MAKVPEFTVADNTFGTIFFGPVDSKNYETGLTILVNSKEMGSRVSYYTDGSKREVIEKSSTEICGTGLDPKQKENVAKSIVADKGDIVLSAERGNVKIIAKNIFIETIGSDNAGVFAVAANGAITLATGDSMTLSSGKSICLRGSSGINIVSDHFITLAGKVREGSPFSSLISSIGLPGPVADLIKNIQTSCK